MGIERPAVARNEMSMMSSLECAHCIVVGGLRLSEGEDERILPAVTTVDGTALCRLHAKVAIGERAEAIPKPGPPIRPPWLYR